MTKKVKTTKAVAKEGNVQAVRAKTGKDFRISKQTKVFMSRLGNDVKRHGWKNMFIDAQVAEHEARLNPTKLRCSDGQPMWA